MKKNICLWGALMIALSAASAWAVSPQETEIAGKYIETRSCDVFTAACFANSEVGLVGEEAIMAWDITRGSFNGIGLEGLKVVAVVKANATLGDPSACPLPAKSILMVDKNADTAQREALIAFAKEMGGELLADTIRVDIESISMEINGCSHEHDCGSLTAGDHVAIKARCLHGADSTCGNDGWYYDPLTSVVSAMPHFTSHDKFTGSGLGVTWNDSGRRGTFVGRFAR